MALVRHIQIDVGSLGDGIGKFSGRGPVVERVA